jgi:hypothetical protein
MVVKAAKAILSSARVILGEVGYLYKEEHDMVYQRWAIGPNERVKSS